MSTLSRRIAAKYLSAFDGSVPKGSSTMETLTNISNWLKEHGMRTDIMKQIRFVGDTAFVPAVGGKTIQLELQ